MAQFSFLFVIAQMSFNCTILVFVGNVLERAECFCMPLSRSVAETTCLLEAPWFSFHNPVNREEEETIPSLRCSKKNWSFRSLP